MMANLKSFYRLSFGNIIEWYDFSLCVYFALFLSQSFFPQFDQYLRLLFSFGAFFIGFLARPIGALLLGGLSDRYSPKVMVHYCIIMMGISTFAIACLPSYYQIGMWSPILFLICRIIQGISAGGQIPGLLVISVNDHNSDKSYAIGVAFSISTLGFLLASLVGWFIMSVFGKGDPNIWRIPFALSAVLFVVYWMMNRGRYTQTASKQTNFQKPSASLFAMLMKQWLAFVAVVIVVTTSGCLYFLFFTYMVTYFIHQLGINSNSAFFMNSVVLLFACILYPLMGKLCDKTSMSKMFGYAWFGISLMIVPLTLTLTAHSITLIMLVMLVLTLLIIIMECAILPQAVAVFKQEWQTSISGFAYSLSCALSGSAPMLAHIMLHHYPRWGLAYLLAGIMATGAIGFLLMQYHISNNLKSTIVNPTS
jgi:MFS family permease